MSEKHMHGGPAFPQHPDAAYDEGLMMRDWFAGQALNVALRIDNDAIYAFGTELCVQATAQWAYRIADAMLKAREE